MAKLKMQSVAKIEKLVLVKLTNQRTVLNENLCADKELLYPKRVGNFEKYWVGDANIYVGSDYESHGLTG